MEDMFEKDFGDLYKESDIRKEKVARLTQSGENPYKNKFERTHKISEVLNLEDGTKVNVAGRVVSKRVMGKFSFINIYDIEGKLQVSFGRNELSEEKYAFFKQMLDIGDYVGVEGEVYTTQTGMKTVKTINFCLLSKAILPLPEKFHGISDTEIKYRQRYLDLIMNEDSRKILYTRSKIVAFIREFLQKNGFMEVETPILQNAVCGANAKPFITKHNALEMECNLRIAPETYLKQVVAGGFDRVFEIAKCFRNEGMDATHLQEFTQVEWYASYWNFEDNITFFTKFFRELVYLALGSYTIKVGEKEFELPETFKRVDYIQTLNEQLGFDILSIDNVDEMKEKVIASKKIIAEEIVPLHTIGAVIDLCYKRLVRVNIIEPTILYNYPNIVPLARQSDENPKTIEMFQFLIDGVELCKAYSELVNPIIQRENLEEQLKAKNLGDDEAMDVDEWFLKAMEHGMPPMSGLGMGIDRLLMLLYNADNIRDCILFPIMGERK